MMKVGISARCAADLSEFDFIPDIVLAVFLSHFPRGQELQKILRQDWARGWVGWQESQEELDTVDAGVHEDATREQVDAATLHRFCRLVLANAPHYHKSDQARQDELRLTQNKVTGVGKVHGQNDCCADSLLQLLAAHGHVPQALQHDVNRRKTLCAANREHLKQHTDERLHPCVLTELGTRADAYQREHDRAYLQHDSHG
jgi:hypothetical protein